MYQPPAPLHPPTHLPHPPSTPLCACAGAAPQGLCTGVESVFVCANGWPFIHNSTEAVSALQHTVNDLAATNTIIIQQYSGMSPAVRGNVWTQMSECECLRVLTGIAES